MNFFLKDCKEFKQNFILYSEQFTRIPIDIKSLEAEKREGGASDQGGIRYPCRCAKTETHPTSVGPGTFPFFFFYAHVLDQHYYKCYRHDNGGDSY